MARNRSHQTKLKTFPEVKTEPPHFGAHPILIRCHFSYNIYACKNVLYGVCVILQILKLVYLYYLCSVIFCCVGKGQSWLTTEIIFTTCFYRSTEETRFL